MEKKKKEELRAHIKSPAVNKNLNVSHQNRHILDSGGYIEGRSYLFSGIDPDVLIKRHHGTGEIRLDSAGNWINKEFVTLDRDVGVYINPSTGEEGITDTFSIHYSKRGAHIVPARPSKRRQK